MKNKFLIIILLIFSIFIISCNQKVDTFYYTFTDDFGNEVKLKEKPQNVACLFSSFAQIWVLAGGDVDITVYETIERGICNQAVLVDNGAGKTINNEALIMAEPDFVICSLDISNQVKTSTLLNNANIPSACFKVETFNDYLKVLDIFTSITGNKDNYLKYGLEVKEKIDDLLSSINDPIYNIERREILFIRASSTPDTTKAKRAEDHFVASMLEELDTYNIANRCEVLLDGLSTEEILLEDPDYIFISVMGDYDAAKQNIENIFSNEVWSNLTAVKNKKYVFLPKELFQFKPNDKWYQAYKYLVDILYEEK